MATAEYNLNQIPYDYIMEVTNRLKGLDLIDRIPEKLWMEVHNIVQESVVKTIPKKKGEGKTLKKQPNEVEIGNLPEKELYDPDKHDDVITHLEPDILECEVSGP